MLKLFLERLDLLDRQSQQLDQMAAEAMQPYEDAVIRLAEAPGFGPDSAQQTIAEEGAQAQSFDSPAQAAVKKKDSQFQIAFQRWIPKLGYQAAIWAIAHKLARLVWKILHDRVHYIERARNPILPSRGVVPKRWSKHFAEWATRLTFPLSVPNLPSVDFQGSG